jgi:hypothetical protein
MMREIITVYGKTDGSSTTGDFSLNGDLLYSAVTTIRIPAGVKVKIWAKRISGKAVTVIVNYAPDITVASPSWKSVDSEYLVSDGEISLEKRRPIVLRGLTGKEGFKLSWSQSTAGVSYVSFDIEFTDEE